MSTRRRKTRSPRRELRVLLTCIGRRVELLQAFRRAGEKLRIDLALHGADASRLAPALHLVDRAHLLPAVSQPEYVDALTTLVRRHRIDLVIPLNDLELLTLANAAPRIEAAGCRVVISSPQVIAICRDKLATHRVLQEAGLDVPETWTWEDALRNRTRRFPCYMKPRAGSAAQGNYVIHDLDELRVLGRRVNEPIVQELVDGIEHTLDVYTGFDGVPRCVVPRRRLEVRTGEVSKSLVVKDRALIDIGRRVAAKLAECRGVITVQCMVTPAGRIRVIEINPRFGGGAPLAIRAGADFPRWLLAEHLGRKPRITEASYKDGVAMLRYDQSAFVPNAPRRLGLSTSPDRARP